MNIKILLISALFLSGTAFSAPIDKDTLFYCQFNNGKQVRIEQHGDKIRYRFGKNLARPELAFEQPANQVFRNYLTPLLDDNQRGEIIEIYLRNGSASYVATVTSTIGKPEYTLSAENADTKHIMTCKERGAFVNLRMVLDLMPVLLDTY